MLLCHNIHWVIFLLLIQPMTELEKEIADVLAGSSNVEKAGEELTDAEKKALLRMSVEEVCIDIYIVACVI